MIKKMHKAVFKVTSALMLLAMFSGSIAGCGRSGKKPREDSGDTTDPVNIAFVVGIADDETRFNDGIQELEELPARPGSDYAFLSVEGSPAVIGEPGTIPYLGDRGYTETMMRRVREGIRQELLLQLEAYEPETAEIDMAKSIDLGARTLKAHMREDRRNYLVLYCSGKSTCGLINMVQCPVFQMDIDSSVSHIAGKMNLDLSAIDVIFYCCGSFGPKQAGLSFEEKERLRSFYEKLFLALGAESITFREDLPNKEYYCFASAPVSPMAVAKQESGLQPLRNLSPEILKEADESFLSSPIVLHEEQVRYLPDSAEFQDPTAAQAVIRPFADYLKKYPDRSVLLYGTCAGDHDTEYSLRLSRDRAEAVMRLLVEDGVEEKRICVVTIRCANDPYYKFGLGTGEAAAVNRKTVIIDTTDKLAGQILAYAE